MNSKNIKERLQSVSSFLVKRPIILLLVLYIILTAIFAPDFFIPSNIRNYFIQCADTIIFSCGFMFLLLNGSIDLSYGAVIGLGSIVSAMIMNNGNGFLKGSPWAIPVGILSIFAVSLIIALMNGLGVIKLKIPSFIATMSTNFIFLGLALALTKAVSIGNLPKAFIALGSQDIFFIPIPVIVATIVAIITGFVISRTIFGKKVYAIGTNPKAAFMSGLPVKKIILQLFLINGLLTAIGIVIFTARMEVGMAMLGANRTLDFIAAVVLGGTSVYGGSGNVTGTILGAMFIILINNSLYMLGATWYVLMMIKGLIIITMAFVDSRRALMEKKI